MFLLSEDHVPFRLPPMGGADDTDLFSFSGSVGPHGENRREDVIKAQTLLARTGDFKSPFDVPTGWPSNDLYRSIKAFQKRHGKQPDGTLLPVPVGGVDQNGVGESLYALRGELSDGFAGQTALTPSEVDAHYKEKGRFRNTIAGEGASVSRQPQTFVTSDVPDAAPPTGQDGAQVAQSNGPSAPQQEPRLGLTIGPIMQAIPEHKKDVFARPENKEAWNAHQAALNKLLPDRPVLRGVLSGLYAEEGGRLPDPKSGAVGGILPDTLDDLQRRGKLAGIPAHLRPADLTPEQQAQVQKIYFDDVLHTVGGAMALENLPQATADAVADTLYLDGRRMGTEFLQQAINDVAGSRKLDVDGAMGPKTMDAIRQLASDPQTRDIWLDEVARLRIDGKKRSPGEIDRISRLRSNRRR